MINKLALGSAICGFIAFPGLASDHYDINQSLSTVSFATIKTQYVVEPASINTLSGKLDDSGQFALSLDLKGVDTGIQIRDDRLSEFYFDAAKYPKVEIKGKADLADLKDGLMKTEVPAEVTMYGNTKSFSFPVIIMKTDDKIMVSSYKPVIVNGKDFGIPTQNLMNLASKVGDIKISESVPLNLTLVFEK